MLPAHATKDLHVLDYRFNANISFQLHQSDNGTHNGTALWLGAQCLAAYLTHFVRPADAVIELGSGIGLTSLVLGALGWRTIIATDTVPVISSVLSRNITNNPVNGNVLVRELDWTVMPDDWTWHSDHHIASTTPTALIDTEDSQLPQPFDLIVTADTVYEPSLIQPLLRTIYALCQMSVQGSAGKPPLVLLCLERRDPALVDSLLVDAQSNWNFRVEQVPSRKLSKALEKSGLTWDRSDWEGVEIWKLFYGAKASNSGCNE